jgi:hypothetical protein
MPTRVEGLVHHPQTNRLTRVADLLEAGTDHEQGRYIMDAYAPISLSIKDTPHAALIDLKGILNIALRQLDILLEPEEYGSFEAYQGIIHIDGVVRLEKHFASKSIIRPEHSREYLRIIYTLPREILTPIVGYVE